MQAVENNINPFKRSTSYQLVEFFDKLFSKEWWAKVYTEITPDIWDYQEELREALMTFLEHERKASLAFTGEPNTFYWGTDGPGRFSGIDFPFIDEEIYDHLTVRVTPEYIFHKDDDFINVAQHIMVLHSGGTESITTLYRRYTRKAFMDAYKRIDADIAILRDWRWVIE